jgi:hypothetical protein
VPAKINSRNFNCALTDCEPLSSSSFMGRIVYSDASKPPQMGQYQSFTRVLTGRCIQFKPPTP